MAWDAPSARAAFVLIAALKVEQGRWGCPSPRFEPGLRQLNAEFAAARQAAEAQP